MSCAMVLEEGLEIDVLERVMKSIGQYTELADVPIVTGDTKVVEQGAVDNMIITTSAIGKRSPFMDHNLEVAREYRPVASRWLTDDNLHAGDWIIVSGTLGDHGVALLSFREGYGFEADVKSDVAPLNNLIEDVLRSGGAVCMKDPTRGGFANAINEWSSKSRTGVEITRPRYHWRNRSKTPVSFWD